MTTALKASSATRSAPDRTRAVGARRARRGRSAHGARRTALVVEGLSVTAPDGTTLVDDVSFWVEAGSLVAVVGPTGAGKSTLLRALTGDAPLASGSVRVYGGRAHGRVGYVPQENVLHSQLDLRRTLDDVASLQLGGAVDAAARRERVQAVLGELGLVEQARLQVGVLSGGQQKRANVAAELVSEPDVLVLDEPTSGLDPGYEKNVLGTLRRLAQRGRTVLAVTHSLRAL
ncbi:MAG: ABC transporter ATP-binding protein, partial [Acidimicrobiia bacterium]|nr:ABC transporter ATP-binding protein [Acidimicrobiia bacterium]